MQISVDVCSILTSVFIFRFSLLMRMSKSPVDSICLKCFNIFATLPQISPETSMSPTSTRSTTLCVASKRRATSLPCKSQSCHAPIDFEGSNPSRNGTNMLCNYLMTSLYYMAHTTTHAAASIPFVAPTLEPVLCCRNNVSGFNAFGVGYNREATNVAQRAIKTIAMTVTMRAKLQGLSFILREC